MEDARPRRVALIKGACNYDHLRCFIDAMKMAFEDEGCVAVEVDLAKGADPQLIAALSRFAPDLVLCFNLDGASLRAPDGGPLGGTALTSWLVDEPYYQAQWAAALRAPHVRTVWTNDRSTAEAQAMGLPDVETVPLAGRTLPRVRGADRDIDVFFAGSIQDPEPMAEAWAKSIGPGVAKLMRQSCEAWETDLRRPLRDVFREACASAGVGAHQGLERLQTMALGPMNRYVRAKHRLRVLRALADLPLTVVGDGWDRLVPAARWRCRPAVPYYVYEEMVSRAKVTLCVQPVHAHGASERYFASLANDSALVVNENAWLEAEYPAMHAPFSLEQPDSARARIEALLGDADAREAMTEAARSRTMEAHTWRHRARQLLSRVARISRAA